MELDQKRVQFNLSVQASLLMLCIFANIFDPTVPHSTISGCRLEITG